ncbi:hypothetical protein R1sor_008741 [Riccia sorocarpa]|uniref:Cytochrome P450 n=1 Tax=Riccia sorocarpa TaxID=122646 RepID=A0ABD3HYA7_9MARC
MYIVKLFGKYKIISTSPEAAKHFLVTHNRSFTQGHRPMARVADPEANFTDPNNHPKVRKLLKTPLGPDNIHQCILVYDTLVCSAISLWKDGQTINARDEMQRITMKCLLNLLWGQEDRQLEYARVFHLQSVVDQGYRTAFPVNLPFTRYGKGIKAKGEFMRLMEEKLAHLRASGSPHSNCMNLIIFSDEKDGLTDAQICSLMHSLIHAGYRTVATLVVRAFKLLSENPQVLATLKKEHDAVSKSMEAGANLTWADVKQMRCCFAARYVIQETMRLSSSSISKFLARVALEDVEYNGYVISKGWELGMTNEFHKDPKLFPDPYIFNPDRFNSPPKPGTFILFGAGMHTCAGIEFANALSAIISHLVVTKFSFEREGPDGVEFWSHYTAKDGFPMKLKLRAEDSN